MGNRNSTPIRDCLDVICSNRSACVTYPNEPIFAWWAKPFNLEFPVIPAAIIRPQNTIEVAETVQCAREHGFKMQAKSGGHSYGNYGLGGVDGAVSIDLVNLKDFQMDNATWYASFGAGNNLEELDKHLHANGKRAIAHGTCPSVGTGGHLTVGGLGPISRMWGSALDHLIEMEVVTAEGASFGTVTNFVVKTREEPGSVVQYTYNIALGLQDDTANLYKEWQALVGDPEMDRQFASLFVVHPLGALITGTFFGTEDGYQATGIPDRLPGVGKGDVWITNWVGHILHEAEVAGCTFGNMPNAFYSKSLSLSKQDLLNGSAVMDLFKYLEDTHSEKTPVTIIFNTEGGAMMDIPANATAYPHRDSVIMYQSYGVGVGKVSAATRKLLDGVHERILRSAPGARSTYAGYIDAWIGREAAQKLYWADNLPQLWEIKKVWDPEDVFHNPQSVEPAD